MRLEKDFQIKQRIISSPKIACCLAILLAAAVRLTLILHDWPYVNSDEATVGLMARHILQGRDYPIFLYGQASLGSLEAYVGAGVFLVLGQSALALRIGVLLLFVVFLIWLYLLTRLLYTRSLALVTLLLFAFGTVEMFARSIPASAGHAETPLFGSLLLLVSVHLGLASVPRYSALPLSQRRKCLLLYALWGCVFGLAFWNDALAGPFMLVAAIFLLICCRHTLRPFSLGALLLGCSVGFLPLFLHDLSAPAGQRSLDVVNYLTVSGPAAQAVPLPQRLLGGFLVTLPVSTGASALCRLPVGASWPLTAHSSAYAMYCTALRGLWAAALSSLWGIAALLEVRGLVRLHKERDRPAGDTPEEAARQRVTHWGRLMLLGAAGLTWVVFASSVQSAFQPAVNHRYLIGLAVAAPALLWPLWSGVALAGRNGSRWAASRRRQVFCALVLLFYGAALLNGTLVCFREFPGTQAYARQQYALVDDLLRLHVKHVYTDYWTCDLISFLTREQVICSVVDDQLQPGFNRYAPYAALVAQDGQAAYLFRRHAPQLQALTARLSQDGKHYRRLTLDGGYVLYLPAG
jgi:hypothetical protein